MENNNQCHECEHEMSRHTVRDYVQCDIDICPCEYISAVQFSPSERPWQYAYTGLRFFQPRYIILDAEQYTVAEGSTESNARLIVKAVNAWNDSQALKARLLELEDRVVA